MTLTVLDTLTDDSQGPSSALNLGKVNSKARALSEYGDPFYLTSQIKAAFARI